MKDLVARGFSALIFVPTVLLCIWYSQISLFILFGLFNIIGLRELQKITLQIPNNTPNKLRTERVVSIIIGCIIYTILGLHGNCLIEDHWLSLILPLLFIFFIRALITDPPNQFGRTATNTLGIIWITIPFALTNYIANFNCEFDPRILMCIFFLGWSYDSGAYCFGRLFGKTKLAPTISPNKTWEGAAGGIFAALFVSYLISIVFTGIYPLKYWMIIGIIVAIFGTLGDLIESLLKRNAGVKDSGNFMPGHGGILDRFDSLIFIVPFVYVFMYLLENLN